jgi:hypothetical protein
MLTVRLRRHLPQLGLLLSLTAGIADLAGGPTNGASGAASHGARSDVDLAARSTWRPLPADTFVNGRAARTVVIDGGAMIISPPPAHVHPALSAKQAATDAKATTTAAPGLVDPAGTALAVVHLSHTIAATVRYPAQQLAWVTVIAPQLGVSCPPLLSGAGAFEPSFHVVAIASSGSSALNYTSRGTGPCGGPIRPPSLSPAAEIRSIAWQGLGSVQVSATPPRYNWTIRYQLPPCGSIFDSPGMFFQQGTPSLFVQVTVPLIPSRSCAAGQSSTIVFGPEDVPVEAAEHAPLGVRQF